MMKLNTGLITIVMILIENHKEDLIIMVADVIILIIKRLDVRVWLRYQSWKYH